MARNTKPGDRLGKQTREQTADLSTFDYNASAELFMSFTRAKGRPKYKRFDTAAEAVRFVVESLPAAVLSGAYVLVDEERFGVEAIRSLYDSDGYPLPRAIER